MNPPQPKPPNLPTTAAPELTRIKPVNRLHLRGESFAAPIDIFVATFGQQAVSSADPSRAFDPVANRWEKMEEAGA